MMPGHVGDSVGMARIYRELGKTGFGGKPVNIIGQKIKVGFAQASLNGDFPNACGAKVDRVFSTDQLRLRIRV